MIAKLISVQKIEKNLGGTPSFFLKKILSQKLFVEFSTFDFWNCGGDLKMMFTVVGCSFRRFIGSKSGI